MSSNIVEDLNLGGVRSTAELRQQADIIKKIADVKMDAYLTNAPEYVKKIHDYGVPKEAIFGLGGTFLSAAVVGVLIFYGAQLLSVFVAVLQPLYYTYKALESDSKDDDTILLTYWMVLGVLLLAESTILYPLVVLLPGFYFLAKIVLQFWMINFNGSTTIYKKLIAPFFRQHEKSVEFQLEKAKREALALAGITVPSAPVDETSAVPQNTRAQKTGSVHEDDL